MTVAALIKYDQGTSHPPAGQALIGTLGTPVTASNGNNADVERWVYAWIATPTGSAILPGVISDGLLPTTTFTPDLTGTYVLALDVYDQFGNVSHDVRCFAVEEASGLVIPNFDADAGSMNFGGQKFGWHPYIEAHLKALNPATVTIPALNIDWQASSYFKKTLGAGANAITFSNVFDKPIMVALTGAGSTVTWPGTVKWLGGTVPTQTASGTDVYTFVSIGGTVYGTVIQNFL